MNLRCYDSRLSKEENALKNIYSIMGSFIAAPIDLNGKILLDGIIPYDKINKKIEMIPDLAGKNVLDIGCGSGYVTKRLASEKNADTVIGLDKDPELIEIARTINFFEKVERIAYMNGNAEMMIESLRDGNFHFDVITSFSAFDCDFIDAVNIFSGIDRELLILEHSNYQMHTKEKILEMIEYVKENLDIEFLGFTDDDRNTFMVVIR